MRKLFIVVINLFILSCVFDPADKVLELKVPLFCISWLFLFISTRNLNSFSIPIELGLYVFVMIFISFLSISFYFISNGAQPYAGFSLLKAHILISFAILLYLSKVNLMKYLCAVLTVLAIAIIAVYIIVLIYPLSFIPLYSFGLDTGIFSIGERVYSSDLKLWSIFFVTSPMLAISIAYYIHLAIESKKKFYILIVLINVFGMFIAGTRNNMFTAIFLPLILLILNTKYKKSIIAISLCLATAFLIYYSESILTMLSPEESSNQTKIDLLDEYVKIFNEPTNLLFGQGLGSYHYWPSRGSNYATELTYLEIIRNFGLIMGLIIVLLMFYPVIYSFYMNKLFPEKHIIIGYIFFLGMAASNPLFFSSMGMLVLAILMANIYLYKNQNTQRKALIVKN